MNRLFAGLPRAYVFSQAMDVIRRQAIECPLETGGIGVGFWNEDGTAVFVTHATPPGPRAVHEACRFRNDPEYQQAALNFLHRKYGVRYVMEWHKHPGGMTHPSGIDHGGAWEILQDPDYNTDSLLCPIVTFDEERGFGMAMYWISREYPRFQPIAWEEVPSFPTEEDLCFTRPPEELLLPGGRLLPRFGGALRRTFDDSLPAPSDVPVPGWYPDIPMGGWNPFALGAPGPFSVWGWSSYASGLDPSWGDVGKRVEPAVLQWYRTDGGRRLLTRELSFLRSFGLEGDLFQTGEGDLGIAFPRNRGREIVLITAPHHPDQGPRLLLRDATANSEREMNPVPWDPQRFRLAHVVVPLLGPDIDQMVERERERLVGHNHASRKEVRTC